MATPGVGTRSKTRQAELGAAEVTQAQASLAVWPQQPDRTAQIQRMTRELQISDRPQDTFREIQNTLPMHKIDENQNEIRPPAAGIRTHQQDVFFIPPPRAGGGAVGVSTPVSTATLGLIHRVDPSLAMQLREDPASLAVCTTRLKSLLHNALDTHWYARPASIPSTVGGGNACPRRTVETVI